MSQTFIQIQDDVVDYLIDQALPGNYMRVFFYLKKIERYGDRYQQMPSMIEIAEHLEISIDTVRRAINKLEELKLFEVKKKLSLIKSGFKNLKTGITRAGKNVRKKIFCPPQNCSTDGKNEEQPAEMLAKTQLCNFQAPKTSPQASFDSPQTIQTLHTSQTGEKNDLKNNTESSQIKNDVQEPSGAKKSQGKNIQVKQELSADVAQLALPIPPDILKKLREIEIEPTEQVIQAIKKHHISQVYGAIAHIKNTWTTIRNPRKVFLYQLPKQEIEKMGMRLSDELIEKAKKEQYAIELESKTPEYQETRNAQFAKIRRILGMDK